MRDSAALLDSTAGHDLGDPYSAPPPARAFSDEVGSEPGRLRIAFTALRPDGRPVHADCVAAVGDAAHLCAELGHDVVERTLPGIDEDIVAAGEAVDGASVAWIDYWVRKLGREPEPPEIEPLTRAWWEQGGRVSGSQYLLAIHALQAFARTIARFFTDVDLWLRPPTPLLERRGSRGYARWPQVAPARITRPDGRHGHRRASGR